VGEVMMAVEEDDEEEDMAALADVEDADDVKDLERVFSDMAPPRECMENCWETQTEISSGSRNNNTETLSG
jgi:hypothetical protein